MASRKAFGSVLFVVPEAIQRLDEYRDLLSRHVGGQVGGIVMVNPENALNLTQERLNREDYDAVCILGGTDLIPHSSVADLTHYDEAVLTDNFYGMKKTPSDSERYSGGSLLPEVPVSRIPTTDFEIVNRLFGVNDNLCPTWEDGFSVSAEVWENASSAVLNSVDPSGTSKPEMSPPFNSSQTSEALSSKTGRLYFNVHGSDQAPEWYGENEYGEFPVVLKSPDIQVAQNAIVVSEACYGARLWGSPDDISMSFLRRGAGAFIGSSIVAWGPPDAPPALADQIVIGTYAALDNGVPLALALLEAKLEILNMYFSVEQGSVSPQVHNTLLSFVSYGFPMATVNCHSRPGGRRPFSHQDGQSKSSESGSALSRLRKQMRNNSDEQVDCKGLLDSYRSRIRQRLPEGTWDVIDSGRMTLSDLSKNFKTYDEIVKKIDFLLGGPPESVDVTRFGFGVEKKSCINASKKFASLTKHVSILLDEDGVILEVFVSK
jgi:hypothetical protein